jgi:hypothetical protein
MVLLFALLTLPPATDWSPMRWFSPDPGHLSLLSGAPFNCLLVEEKHWSAALVEAAHRDGRVMLAVIHPGRNTAEQASRAASLNFDGIAAEGHFPATAIESIRQSAGARPVIEIVPRARLRFSGVPVVATYQGVWPGIAPEEESSAKAAPSGAPWIHTNTGFLRFVRAAAGDLPVWIANQPPSGQAITPQRYMQAYGDAAIAGARWVLALDEDLAEKLRAADERAIAEWKQIVRFAAWFEEHKEWRRLRPAGLLALIQDKGSGALFSGGILDMIAVKHTPVRIVPATGLTIERMQGAKMAVNVDPSSLTETQKEVLRAFTRSGGALLNGPPDWKFPPATSDQITLSEEDIKKLDEIWKEVNTLTGRRNLGVRLFNVSSMLSNLSTSPDGRQTILHLLNYAEFPVESITAHVLGKFRSARLITPEGLAQTLETYEVEEGTGVDIPKVSVAAAVILE